MNSWGTGEWIACGAGVYLLVNWTIWGLTCLDEDVNPNRPYRDLVEFGFLSLAFTLVGLPLFIIGMIVEGPKQLFPGLFAARNRARNHHG